jgi:hypothetical protein
MYAAPGKRHPSRHVPACHGDHDCGNAYCRKSRPRPSAWNAQANKAHAGGTRTVLAAGMPIDDRRFALQRIEGQLRKANGRERRFWRVAHEAILGRMELKWEVCVPAGLIAARPTLPPASPHLRQLADLQRDGPCYDTAGKGTLDGNCVRWLI